MVLMMNVWTALLDVLIILAAALVLGGVFERFKQNAILGYLLAGTLVGPHALDLIPNHDAGFIKIHENVFDAVKIEICLTADARAVAERRLS